MKSWSCEDCWYRKELKQGLAVLDACTATLKQMREKPFPCYVEINEEGVKGRFNDWGY